MTFLLIFSTTFCGTPFHGFTPSRKETLMPWLPTAGCPEWNIILSWRKHNGEGLYLTGNLVFALQWTVWKDWKKGCSLATRRLLCVRFPFEFFFSYPILSSLCFNVLFPVCSVRSVLVVVGSAMNTIYRFTGKRTRRKLFNSLSIILRKEVIKAVFYALPLLPFIH